MEHRVNQFLRESPLVSMLKTSGHGSFTSVFEVRIYFFKNFRWPSTLGRLCRAAKEKQLRGKPVVYLNCSNKFKHRCRWKIKMEMRNPNITPDMDEEGFQRFLSFWLVDIGHHFENLYEYSFLENWVVLPNEDPQEHVDESCWVEGIKHYNSKHGQFLNGTCKNVPMFELTSLFQLKNWGRQGAKGWLLKMERSKMFLQMFHWRHGHRRLHVLAGSLENQRILILNIRLLNHKMEMFMKSQRRQWWQIKTMLTKMLTKAV